MIEKECYPIVIALSKLKHYLMSESPFHMFCDHRNLIFVLDPDKDLGKTTTDRLMRWASRLVSFRYIINHIPGTKNLWADLLTRWGAKRDVKVRTMRVPNIPNFDNIEWTSVSEIARKQVESISELRDNDIDFSYLNYDEDKQVWLMNDKIWIPDEDLATRLMTIGHAGSAGHRGFDSTFRAISSRFSWKGIKDDIARFTESCLHCLRGHPSLVPRPLGEQVHGTRPNEVLHFDYAKVYDKYVLIIRDDLSGFIHLRFTASAEARHVVQCLLEWVSDFGIPKMFVSDQGSHFKNKVTAILSKMLHIEHHFVVAYSPF